MTYPAVYTTKDPEALIQVLKADEGLYNKLMRTADTIASDFEVLIWYSFQHFSSETGGSASVVNDALKSTVKRATKHVVRFLTYANGASPSTADIVVAKEKLESFALDRLTRSGPFPLEPDYRFTARLSFHATMFEMRLMKSHINPQHASIMQDQLGLVKLENDGRLAYCSKSYFANDLTIDLSEGPAATLKLGLAAIIVELFVW